MDKSILKNITVLLCLAVSLLFSCSKPYVPPHKGGMKISANQPLPNTPILNLLYDQHNKWKGTPYKNGGLSKKGIDCSGFVHVSYRDLFHKKLPRTTKKLKQSGKEISRKRLQAGDLLFFKTGWFTHHVGIYLERDRFLHVSTSKGVIISSLNNNFWKDSFYLAKRLPLRNISS